MSGSDPANRRQDRGRHRLVASMHLRTGKGQGVDRWQKTRWWTAVGLYLAAAPSAPAAAWLLYDRQGPNPATLAVTVVAGATAVLCLIGGITAARSAHAQGWGTPRPHRARHGAGRDHGS
jgi:hypothetical protein